MNKFEHGGRAYDNAVKLDFTANINPLGMPESVKEALINGIDGFVAYPDADCTGLIKKLSAYEMIKAENIVCGNGAAELIYRIVYALKPKRALLASPCFSEYEKALTEFGCAVDFYRSSEKNDFLPDEDIIEMLSDGVDIFFLCNPNNPVGKTIEPKLLRRIADRCVEKEIILVADECFMDFVGQSEKYSIKPLWRDNMIILKAFTKIYAMAGLRLGYALFGSKNLAKSVKHIGQCWSVSAAAQLAGAAALDETEYRIKTVELIYHEREYLYSALTRIGFKVYPSCTNFLLFRSEIPLEKRLAAYGIAIRSCANYDGLDERYYRTAVRLHSENAALVEALEKITALLP